MGVTAATGNTTAALSNQAAGLLGQIQNLPGGAATLAQGGLGAAANTLIANATGGGVAPAVGTATATTGTPATATATTATTGVGGTPIPTYDMRVQATGQYQALEVQGKMRYFDAGVDPITNQPYGDGQAREISLFQYVQAAEIDTKLDTRPGLATGLNNLSQLLGAQQRVSLLTAAVAQDASSNGAFNPIDLQRAQTESTTTAQLAELTKSIFDNMKKAIDPWTRG